MDRRLRNHIARHNITSYEVEQALYTHPRLAVPGREDTTEVLGITTAGRHLLIVTTEVLGITTAGRHLLIVTTEVLGITTAGRHLLVVVTEAANGRDYIITARDMSPTEKRTFRAKGH
jgi:uncharacterized DUF497 family protein